MKGMSQHAVIDLTGDSRTEGSWEVTFPLE